MALVATRAFVGIGTNLGDRHANLAFALRSLRAARGVGQVTCSPVYETDPVGPPQPAYLNAAVSLVTTLEARELLRLLQAIELGAGRERGPERNAPRTLDLDLLLYGDARIDEPGLEVPHPRMHERAFVLVPLCDLAPDARHPVLGQTVRAMLEGVQGRDGVRPC